MAIKDIVIAPNPILRTPADHINEVNLQDYIQGCSDLDETLKNSTGLGLAAVQIGWNARVFTMVDGNGNNDIYINPVISATGKRKVKSTEGCLSLPNTFRTVWRHFEVTVEYTTIKGEHCAKKFKGLLSTVAQHEIDHLNGVLIIDYDPAAIRAI